MVSWYWSVKRTPCSSVSFGRLMGFASRSCVTFGVMEVILPQAYLDLRRRRILPIVSVRGV